MLGNNVLEQEHLKDDQEFNEYLSHKYCMVNLLLHYFSFSRMALFHHHCSLIPSLWWFGFKISVFLLSPIYFMFYYYRIYTSLLTAAFKVFVDLLCLWVWASYSSSAQISNSIILITRDLYMHIGASHSSSAQISNSIILITQDLYVLNKKNECIICT